MFNEPNAEQLEDVKKKLREVIENNFSKEEIYQLFCLIDEDANYIIHSMLGDMAKLAAPSNFTTPE